MAKAAKEGFVSDFRRFFFRGVATLLPTVLTIYVLVVCFKFIQQNISVHITYGAVWLVVKATSYDIDSPEAQQARFETLYSEWTQGLRSLAGFGVAIILVYILGRLLASFFGRRIWQIFERSVGRIPGFKQVYPYVKKVTEFIFGENKIEITRVVAVQYPRKGIWSIGFVTGAGFKKIHETLGEEFMTVFIPSSPMPVTGYVVTVKKDEAIDLPIAVDEALRFTVSGGVIVPDHQALPGGRIELSPGPEVKVSRVEGSEMSQG